MATKPRDIFAIDPGSTASGVVRIDAEGNVMAGSVSDNNQVARTLRSIPALTNNAPHLAIEMMTPRGMPTSAQEMETLVWIGRFVEAWGYDWIRVRRLDVKLFLCGDTRAKDANIRQAILDRYPATGGGKTPQIGTKSKPGPLHGFKSHMFAALGVALVARHQLSAPSAANTEGAKA